MMQGQGMIQAFKDIYAYRELLAVLAWKNVIVRYKQAYLGLLWTVLKPVMLVAMFSVVPGMPTNPAPMESAARIIRGTVMVFGDSCGWAWTATGPVKVTRKMRNI